MKRAIFFILVTMLAYTPANAQVYFEDSSFDEALNKAKREGKTLFLICDVRSNDVEKKENLFGNKNLGYLMNNKYVNYHLSSFRGEGRYLALQYKINVFPTMMLINSDGEELSRHVSMQNYDPESFVSALKSMTDNSISSGREKFRKSLDGANQYVQLLNDNYLVEERNIAIVDLFNRRTKEENYEKENFDFYSSMINSIHHPIAKFTLNDKKDAVKYLGKKKYKEFIVDKMNTTLNTGFHQGTITHKDIEQLNEIAKKNKEASTLLLSYYTSNLPLTKEGNVDKIMKNTLKIFNKLNEREKKDVIRFVNTISIRENRLKDMIPFYEHIISSSKSDTDKKKYQEAKRHIENFFSL